MEAAARFTAAVILDARAGVQTGRQLSLAVMGGMQDRKAVNSPGRKTAGVGAEVLDQAFPGTSRKPGRRWQEVNFEYVNS